MSPRMLLIIALVACAGDPPPPAEKPPEVVAKATPEPPAAPEPEAAPAEVGPANLEEGAVVYTTYCQACHQADGSGLNSMLAANFKEKGRLDKTDDELLASIRDGVTGKVGTMPPWKGTLSDQDSVNVLAHIRKTYGE